MTAVDSRSKARSLKERRKRCRRQTICTFLPSSSFSCNIQSNISQLSKNAVQLFSSHPSQLQLFNSCPSRQEFNGYCCCRRCKAASSSPVVDATQQCEHHQVLCCCYGRTYYLVHNIPLESLPLQSICYQRSEGVEDQEGSSLGRKVGHPISH
jgi:hypothetical protein